MCLYQCVTEISITINRSQGILLKWLYNEAFLGSDQYDIPKTIVILVLELYLNEIHQGNYCINIIHDTQKLVYDCN